jgi:hypothetical protein
MKNPKNKNVAVSKRTTSKKRAKAGIAWGNLPEKQRIFLSIMREIIAKPSLGDTYLNSDKEAANAFRAKGMDVPSDIKVVFVRAGDTAKLGASSAIIELPPPNASSDMKDEELTELFVGLYHINW